MTPFLRTLVACVLGLSALTASAATTVGNNFDGKMSLIYDFFSGNVFIENAPHPNPHERLVRIQSASGLLIPANLNLPLVPPPTVNVIPNSLNPILADQISISWPINVLGSGSFLGQILPPFQSAASLLSDLTIIYGTALLPPPLPPGFYNPVNGPNTGDLIHLDILGTTQFNPILPNAGNNGFFRFFNVATGQFFDPPTTTGYNYTMDSALTYFTKVVLPVGLGSNFSISSSQGTFANILEGDQHTFASPGVTSFSILGINPPVDGNLPDAFPVYLEFSAATANFSMQAIPEPAALLMALVGFGATVARRRKFLVA